MMKQLAVLTAVALASATACFAEAVVGEAAPAFTLTDTNGKDHNLGDFKGKYIVLEWINHDCPFVKKHYESGNMQKHQKAAAEKGVVWLSINSSAPGKQGNYPAEKWNEMTAEKGGAATAVLLDESGAAGKAYGAKTTPHMFVINPEGVVIYAGAIDDKRGTDPEEIASAKNLVDAALAEAMAGQPVSVPSSQPYGCGVKYAD